MAVKKLGGKFRKCHTDLNDTDHFHFIFLCFGAVCAKIFLSGVLLIFQIFQIVFQSLGLKISHLPISARIVIRDVDFKQYSINF